MEGTMTLRVVASTLLISAAALIISRRLKKRMKNRTWSRQWLKRKNKGILSMINQELYHEDQPAYKNYLRLTTIQFESLLTMVEPHIGKSDTNMRECISARSRLQVTLRFLATGESYRSLMYSTRIHESTISKFIPNVCQAIYTCLRTSYLTTPTSTDEWKKTSLNFLNMWQFPNCLGALDGRHIKFQAPRSEESYFYNYKGNHSIVLLAMVDATYKFTYVNVGTNGRVSDGGVFRESQLSKAIASKRLNFPANESLPGRTLRVPYVIVADDAFPLSNHIMKPYPQRGLSKESRIYNYRLSRARRVVENSFGILANRFRVLLNPINLCAEKVEIITLACCALHNFLIAENGQRYTDMELEDDATHTSHLVPVAWHNCNRSTNEAQKIRDEFKIYFNSAVGEVQWQEEAILKHNL